MRPSGPARKPNTSRCGGQAPIPRSLRPPAQRLRLLSIPDSMVESAERNDAPEVRYTLIAPRSGIVADLAVRDGAMVTPGMTLMRIVSLSDVWVYAEIPEAAGAKVAVGANAEIRLPANPEQVLRGRVSALLPQVNRDRAARCAPASNCRIPAVD